MTRTCLCAGAVARGGGGFPGWVLPAAAVQVGSAGVALGAPAQSTAAQVWAVVALGAVAALGAALVARVTGRRERGALLVG